ncbi:MAG TPA: hypothetical protein PLC04_07905 [Candidatus Kapabacteria bacterium]|nr:hypothetical protein [Candidatus Kapabacteria bacterium]
MNAKKEKKSTKKTAENFILEKEKGVQAQITQSISVEEQSIIDALQLKQLIDDYSAKLDAIKDYWKEKLDNDDTSQKFITAFGAVERRTTHNYSVIPDKYLDLKKLFGDQIGLFVEEKINYGVKPALRELVFDADYKYKEIIRKAVAIKSSTTITFIKPNKK